ncbi:MAG: hypothetical protein K2X66_15800 [Cyanobacteria bacterium]|nr:hypothetical protein [Cyanobacteriota bacterium]
MAQADPNAKIVAGKIVAVSHEKVTVNNVVMDKSMVTVDNCDARGTLTTVNFTPSTISDRSILGHLFGKTILSAKATNLEKLQQPNGFCVFGWITTVKF